MRLGAFCAISIILGFAMALSSMQMANASEDRATTEESGSATGAEGQSADGEKDIRDVGEAGGGGQSSGNMKPIDADPRLPAADPEPSHEPSKKR